MEEWVRGLLVLATAVVLSRWLRRPPAAAAEPSTAPDAFDVAAAASPAHSLAARAAWTNFQAAVRDVGDAAGVRRLFAHRALVQTHLNEAVMRLPNDLTAERRLAAAAEDLDRAMLEQIEAARQRVGAPGVHPGPLDAAWYGQWYRAANDSVS